VTNATADSGQAIEAEGSSEEEAEQELDEAMDRARGESPTPATDESPDPHESIPSSESPDPSAFSPETAPPETAEPGTTAGDSSEGETSEDRPLTIPPAQRGSLTREMGGDALAEAEAASTQEPASPEEVDTELEEEEAQAEAEQTGGEITPAEQSAAIAMLETGTDSGEPSVGGGGGGGGSAIEQKPDPAVPDVSGQEPEAALGALKSLPPVPLQQALSGVNSSIDASVTARRKDLQAHPPEMDRPSGAPTTKDPSAAIGSTDQTEAKGREKSVEPTPEGEEIATPEPAPLPPETQKPTARVPEPNVRGSENGEVTEADAANMQASVRSMPTRDADLAQSPGPPPTVELTGNADPAQADQQDAKLQQKTAALQAQGSRDAAVDMGENRIYPVVPPETLRAKVPDGGAAEGGNIAAEQVDDSQGISILAREEKSAEIQAAVAQGQSQLTARKQEHQTQVTEEKAKTKEAIAQAESENAIQQAKVRQQAQTDVRGERGSLLSEQNRLVGEANSERTKKLLDGKQEVRSKQLEADSASADHVKAGNEEASQERLKAEKQAQEKKNEAKKESGGVFGWLASKAKAFFNKLKQGITAIFDAARKLVRAAIEKAKKLAVAVIEKARQWIVTAIRKLGDALIAIGDKLLAGFPALREKFRNKVKALVKAAEDKVNQLAEALKKGITKLLDALGAALDAALGLLEKGLKAVVDAVNSVVQGAISWAKAAYQALAVFAVLIKDIAGHPIGWLSNLGSAVIDGIKNHLWKAFKVAVKEWFNAKLDQVLGLGKAVWDLLKKGGITLARIGKMAWQGLKALIPVTLIQILVEKVASLIVPAAGAVKVIIEGLQAAWGSVSAIIQAFQRFFAFLKAVKGGSAGPKFAAALAAAAVVVIDFVANWLLLKLAKGAAKIGKKIKGLAKSLGKRLGRRKRAKARGKGRNGITGKAKPGSKPTRGKGKARNKKDKKKEDKARKKRERQAKARRETKAALSKLLSQGVSKLRLKVSILRLKLRYRWRTLRLRGGKGSESFSVYGGFSPGEDLVEGSISVKVRPMSSKIHDRPKATQSGANWEQATNPIVQKELAPELFGERGFETTRGVVGGKGGDPRNAPSLFEKPTSGHRLDSRLDKVRLKHQRGRVTHGFKKIPDWSAERFESPPGGTKQLTEVHLIEQTLVADFLARNKFAQHKKLQITGTLFNETLRKAYREASPKPKITYHIIAPQAPDNATKQLILHQIKKSGATNVEVIWRVVG